MWAVSHWTDAVTGSSCLQYKLAIAYSSIEASVAPKAIFYQKEVVHYETRVLLPFERLESVMCMLKTPTKLSNNYSMFIAILFEDRNLRVQMSVNILSFIYK